MLSKMKKNHQNLTIQINTSDLAPPQIRLLKSLVATTSQVLTTNQESEFFTNSAELMRLTASIIQQSRFASNESKENIPYDLQALEYALDVLQDQISMAKVITYDN